MNELTVQGLESYLYELYGAKANEQSLFMKLIEEIGEVAEVLNIRAGRKHGENDSNEELAKELADVIHYTVAIAAINRIDLAAAILEKDKRASVKYNHPYALEAFLQKKNDSV